jgi:cytoskeletal protein CcmA (bactofilin family)
MKNKGKNKMTGPTNTPDQLNRVVEGTSIKGDVKTDSNFRLDGMLNGTLNASGKLVIGVTGKVEGEIICGNADVEGEINGDIKVDGILVLKSTARINGNIVAGKIAVENGAEFNGNCTMGATPIENSKPVVKENGKESKSELVY